MKNTEFTKHMDSKKRILAEAGERLKEHFVGLDEIIDKILQYIEVWYVMPELINRPVIINLWGMTGVGKTDLVRRLVDLVGFTDRYCDVELSDNGSSFFYSRIASLIRDYPSIKPGNPAVLLLDEIQYFRTISNAGEEIKNPKYNDIWPLLSDGKLQHSPDIDFLMEYIYDNKPEEKEGKWFGKEKRDEETLTYYQLRKYKEALRLDDSIDEIAGWDQRKKRNVAIARLNNKQLYRMDDYSKFLIFISGNIDEAFDIASLTSDTDVDADVYHDMTRNITIIDVKESLKNRFRPEQIARFGNTHIIYPSLNKKSYQDIIRKRLRVIETSIRDKFGISIEFEKSINDLVYRNGVFPTQGVRPLLSSISQIIENNIPKLVYNAIIEEAPAIRISYVEGAIRGLMGGRTYAIQFQGEIDMIKERKQGNINRKALLSVHEAGHAVTYAALFGLAPIQVSINTASSDDSGFIGTHDMCYSKRMTVNRVAVLLAGKEAERIVFGDDLVTSGSSSDIRKATYFTSSMIRQWGMGDHVASFTNRHDLKESCLDAYKLDDQEVEHVMREICDNARKIIIENKELFDEIVGYLIKYGEITPEIFSDICSGHGLDVKIRDYKHILYDEFSYHLKTIPGQGPVESSREYELNKINSKINE